jgi:hypothetical protein
MRFAVKHAIAAIVVIAGIAAFTAALYFALFAAAVIFDQPLGSPIAGPLTVLFAVVASIISIVVVLLPVTAVTEWTCQRRGRVWWQIPIATAVMGMWLLVLDACRRTSRRADRVHGSPRRNQLSPSSGTAGDLLVVDAVCCLHPQNHDVVAAEGRILAAQVEHANWHAMN